MTFDVMLLEPLVQKRNAFRSLVHRHEAFGKCVVSGTLEEGASRVRNGVGVDTYFISNSFDTALIGGFMRFNRSATRRAVPNLLVLSTLTRMMSPGDFGDNPPDGYLVEPKCVDDLNPSVEFVASFVTAPVQNKVNESGNVLRSLCARLALAVDNKLHDEHGELEALNEYLRNLPASELQLYYAELISYFTKIASPEELARIQKKASGFVV